MVDHTVHGQTVIDLIRENHQIILSGKGSDLLQHLFRINSPRGVIGIDDHNGFRLIRDLAAHIFYIRIPVRLLITDIMHSLSSGQCHTAGPQRIVRGRYQDLIPVINKPLGYHIDEFTDAVTRIDILQGNIFYFFDLAILHNCFSGSKYPVGI